MKICAIIPAAGHGARMGKTIPKQFLEFNGKPILRHTLHVFKTCGLFDSLVLVAPPDAMRAAEEECAGIEIAVVPGGEKRQDSVFQGVRALDADTEIVVVHDGVRPFVSRRMIRESVDAARRFGAAITAIPVNDTVKRASPEGFVERTIDRESLWRIQTPQAFQYSLLRQALEQAAADGYYGTDEGALIEHIGKPVKIIRGSELNIKITRPEDLVLGETIAAAGNFLED
ncbi:MAG: 2-C-methyl-D-erythritol 4-phosphate cytidylyltransferase [Nitrospinales bacterium]